MFNLFKKQISPKVFAVYYEYQDKSSGNTYNKLTLLCGYSLEDVREEIKKEVGGGIKIILAVDHDLEDYLREYSTEKVSLDKIKQ